MEIKNTHFRNYAGMAYFLQAIKFPNSLFDYFSSACAWVLRGMVLISIVAVIHVASLVSSFFDGLEEVLLFRCFIFTYISIKPNSSFIN